MNLTQQEELRGREAQDSKEGSHSHSFKVTAKRETQGRMDLGHVQPGGWQNGRIPLRCWIWPIPVCPGQVRLNLHSFICAVRGWSEAFSILTFQRLRTLVIKNGAKGERKKE